MSDSHKTELAIHRAKQTQEPIRPIRPIAAHAKRMVDANLRMSSMKFECSIGVLPGHRKSVGLIGSTLSRVENHCAVDLVFAV